MVDRFLRYSAAFFWGASKAVVAIGGLGLIVATLITCVSIISRIVRRFLDTVFGAYFDSAAWAFIRPILGEEELVSYAVGIALFSALPWAMLNKAHIRVDLFAPVFGARFNRFLDFMSDLALAIIAYLLMTRQWFLVFKKGRRSQPSFVEELMAGNFSVFAKRLRDTHESQVLGIPLWPSYVIAEICIILFFLTACFCVLQSFCAFIRMQPAPSGGGADSDDRRR